MLRWENRPEIVSVIGPSWYPFGGEHVLFDVVPMLEYSQQVSLYYGDAIVDHELGLDQIERVRDPPGHPSVKQNSNTGE